MQLGIIWREQKIAEIVSMFLAEQKIAEIFGSYIPKLAIVMIVITLVKTRKILTKFLLFILAIRFYFPDSFLNHTIFPTLIIVIIVQTFLVVSGLEIKVIVF